MEKIFNTFQLHKICLSNNTDFIEQYILADLFIAAAYFILPFVLIYFFIFRYHAHRYITFWWAIFSLNIAGFIFMCGLTHYMGVHVTIIEPDYRLQLLIKQITAGVSWSAIIVLIIAFFKCPIKCGRCKYEPKH